MDHNNRIIWIINPYASHLETRHLELANSFSQLGYSVVVITSSFHHGKREYIYDQKIKIVQRFKNVNYVYLRSGPAYRKNSVGRIFNITDFCRLTLRYHKQISKQLGAPGYIIASSEPPFVWEPGYKLARKYNAKYIVEIKDIWPLSLIEVQGVSPKHPFVKLLEIIEKRGYKHADAIVTSMQYAWKHICKIDSNYRNKIFWMPNGINIKQTDEWFEEYTELPPGLDEFLSKHWCCVYVGSIVISECVDYLIEAIGSLSDEDVYFAVIGEGHEKENIRTLIEQKDIKNAKLFPFIDRKYIPAVLNKAKCCVAAYKTLEVGRFGMSMNKLSDYLYSGKPTVFAFDLESVVSDAGHYTVPYGDVGEMRNTILSIKNADEKTLEQLSAKGKEEILKHYDYQKIGESYLEVLENC